MHHIYLVPGFFGFTNLGRLRYFGKRVTKDMPVREPRWHGV